METIKVQLKEVYGTVKAYPANEQAVKLAALAGSKTLTARTLRLAVDLGLKVEEVYGRNWQEAA